MQATDEALMFVVENYQIIEVAKLAALMSHFATRCTINPCSGAHGLDFFSD
jgi:hypothetical protein